MLVSSFFFEIICLSVLEQEVLFLSLVFTFVRTVAECTLPNAACLVDKLIFLKGNVDKLIA